MEEIVLELECPRCKGKGEYVDTDSDYRRTKSCGNCDGHGTIPTELGEKILDFVQRRLKIRSIVTSERPRY